MPTLHLHIHRTKDRRHKDASIDYTAAYLYAMRETGGDKDTSRAFAKGYESNGGSGKMGVREWENRVGKLKHSGYGDRKAKDETLPGHRNSSIASYLTKTCPTCKGSGKVEAEAAYTSPGAKPLMTWCPTCGGVGKVKDALGLGTGARTGMRVRLSAPDENGKVTVQWEPGFMKTAKKVFPNEAAAREFIAQLKSGTDAAPASPEYNPEAVNKAIASSSAKIKPKEATAIHRLLKGRTGDGVRHKVHDCPGCSGTCQHPKVKTRAKPRDGQPDTSHLVAIHARLDREKARFKAATNEKERKFRAVQVSQAEKELAAEMRFLGMKSSPLPNMSNEELLRELGEDSKAKVHDAYKVIKACYADVDNRGEVQLRVGEMLTWLGGDSSGTEYRRSNGDVVTVGGYDDENCIDDAQ